MRSILTALILTTFAAAPCFAEEHAAISNLVGRYALANGVPQSLVERVIVRESGFNPHLHGRSFYGLMQIRPATARSLGYRGNPAGLLDPETNLAYGVLYLANAYRVAGGNSERAVRLYSSGYYYEAKRRHMLGAIKTQVARPTQVALTPAPTAVVQQAH